MYKIEYLELALKDMQEIVQYISHHLNNPDAANALAEKFIQHAESLSSMPYIYSTYQPLQPLKKEYRKIAVDHYNMFYTVDEENKVVIITRIIYSKRNLNTNDF